MLKITLFFLLFLNNALHIVEKNPSKFKIDNKELTNRKLFIEQARDEVKVGFSYGVHIILNPEP